MNEGTKRKQKKKKIGNFTRSIAPKIEMLIQYFVMGQSKINTPLCMCRRFFNSPSILDRSKHATEENKKSHRKSKKPNTSNRTESKN